MFRDSSNLNTLPARVEVAVQQALTISRGLRTSDALSFELFPWRTKTINSRKSAEKKEELTAFGCSIKIHRSPQRLAKKKKHELKHLARHQDAEIKSKSSKVMCSGERPKKIVRQE